MTPIVEAKLTDLVNSSPLLSLEDKQKWLSAIQGMPDDIASFLIEGLQAKTPEELQNIKLKVTQKKEETQKIIENATEVGIKNIYKEAEKVSASGDESSKDALLSELNKV